MIKCPTEHTLLKIIQKIPGSASWFKSLPKINHLRNTNAGENITSLAEVKIIAIREQAR